MNPIYNTRKETKRLRVTTYFQRERQKRSNELIQKKSKEPIRRKEAKRVRATAYFQRERQKRSNELIQIKEAKR